MNFVSGKLKIALLLNRLVEWPTFFSKSNEMNTIFVYGTLKRGFCREEYLANQTFLGQAMTKPLYGLVDCGDYPGLLQLDDLAHQRLAKSIHGELYEVDELCKRILDRVEDVDGGLYRFDKIQIESITPNRVGLMNKNGPPIFAYFYAKDATGFPDCGRAWTKK